jgi:hypothetical protein
MPPAPPQSPLRVRFGLTPAGGGLRAQRLAGGLSLAALAIALIPPLAHLLSFWALIPVMLSWIVWARSGRRPALRDGVIACTEGELFLRARGRRPLALPPEAAVGGLVVPRYGGFDVEISLRNGRLLIVEAASMAAAERVLAALGVGAERRRSRVDLVDREGAERALTWLLCVAPAAVLLAAENLPWAALVFMTVFFAAPALGRLERLARRATSVTVGLDGVEIRCGRAVRFVPLAGAREVRIAEKAVEIERDDGELVEVVGRAGFSEERVRAVVLRVREAIEVQRRRAGAGAHAALARGPRSVTAWREELRVLAARGGYRAAAISREDLVEVLEDPTAPAERRVGAALALAGTDDDATRERLRIAADTCASPRLRVALDGIAGAAPDDEAIEAALAEEDAGRAGRRSRA